MAKLTILTAPDPFLKTRARPVLAVTDDVRRLMDDMLETMYAADGIGLAAVQVGRTERVIVIDIAARKDGEPHPIAMANPEVIWQSDDLSVFEEGCLSVPEQTADVERPACITVRYLDRDNVAREMSVDGLFATCIQHEIDHLNGRLFIDHLSQIKRGIILRKLKKAKRDAA